MANCPRCYNTSCPEPTEVTITSTTMSLDTKLYENAGFSGSVITLADLIYEEFPPQVYVNGVLTPSSNYTIDNTGSVATITFTSPLVSANVAVVYVVGS